MAKRGQGEGSISKRPDGTWCGRLTVGYGEDGKQKRKAFYGKTKKEVKEKMDAVKAELNAGSYIEASKMTVSEWLETWLHEYKKRSVKPTSYKIIRLAVTKHILPSIGKCELKDLRADMIQKMINELLDKGYAPETIKKAHSTLHSALEQAVDNEIISKNVSKKIILPRIEKKKMRILTIAEQKKFVEIASQTYKGKAYILALYTGLRIGEFVALTWDDVNFKDSTLRVNKTQIEYRDYDMPKGTLIRELGTPKTVTSNRIIPLIPELADMLKQMKKEQIMENDLIFGLPDGSLMPFNTIRKEFNRIKKTLGFNDLTVHCLRHTFASTGLEKGIELKVMQELLGHSSIKMTADIYTHLLPDKKKNSIMKLSGIVNL